MKIDTKIVDWLASGNVGSSSKCMAFHLTGREHDGSYPHDSSDFERCVGLLKAVPELREKLHEMATANSYWAVLVKHWDELEANLSTERIREIYKPLHDKDKNYIQLKGASIRFGSPK